MEGLKIVDPMTRDKKMIVEISPVLLFNFLQRRRHELKKIRDKSPDLAKWCADQILASTLMERQITKIHQMKVEG